MEIWDIYDKDRNFTGKTMVEGEKFPQGAFHLVVHVCIFNSQGKMLIQHRQPFKERWPNLWDLTVGGRAQAGDSSSKAAEREAFEELGLKLNLQNVRPSLTINFDYGFDDYYLIEKNIDLSRLKLQDEEVSEVKWATKEEIISMIDHKEFIPYHKSFIELLFDMRKAMGCIIRD